MKNLKLATKNIKLLVGTVALLLAAGVAYADNYSDTIAVFKRAGESREFFKGSYGYAVFPTVGEGGFVVGGAFGKGRVYGHGRYLGNATLTQVSAGFQAGGKAYSEIIFFQNKAALEMFESGSFEFAAGVSAVAVTAAAGASAGTTGAQAGASGTENNATTVGAYHNGLAVFTVAKGGLMYAATVSGQKFSFKRRGAG
ncbi:MAG: YSC84-related protein [Pseudomonadota bacterium]|nr:YSC84-related protein [Pseudomonadota bacterium]